MIKPELIFSFMTSLAVKIIYCIIIIAVCSILIKISGKAISGIFNSKVTESRHIDSKKAATLGAVISSVVKYTIMFVGVCSALVNFGVPPATLAAVLGTGTVAIGLGAQNVIKRYNFRLFYTSRKPVRRRGYGYNKQRNRHG